MNRILIALAASWLSACAAAMEPSRTISTSDPAAWRPVDRQVSFVEDGGRKIIRLDAGPNEGVAWLIGSSFQNGTIELELRGKDIPQQSFVGVAFRGVDDRTFDAVYFRPFNFKAANPENRAHAVQYHSSPDFPWSRLRAEQPNRYEKPVQPVPDPNDWFKARIVIDGDRVEVFVADATEPSLAVTALSRQKNGMLGLWVGNNSGGDFANLKLTPRQRPG